MLDHTAEIFTEYADDEKTCICFEPVIVVEELARAYVPIQFMCDLFKKEDSIIKGTIFPELYSDYKK